MEKKIEDYLGSLNNLILYKYSVEKHPCRYCGKKFNLIMLNLHESEHLIKKLLPIPKR